MRDAQHYGITRILGVPEHAWMRGAGVAFTLNMSASLPPVCATDVAAGDEHRAHCLRWPARALTALGACPRGESDVDPFTRDALALPMCKSTAISLTAGARKAAPTTRGCLIYSFGIGGNARWEHYMARSLRCEVHAFDPTIRLREAHTKRASSTPGPRHGESALRPWPPAPSRLFFHFAGLRGGVTGGGDVSGSTGGTNPATAGSRLAAADNERLYGSINTSVLYSLPELMQKLGHHQRGLDVLKLDCEGCEWAVLAPENPLASLPLAVRHSLQALFVELHLSDTFIPPTPLQYEGLWRTILSPIPNGLGMAMAFRHDNIGEFASPYRAGRLPAGLAALGAPEGQCCVEYAFIRANSTYSVSEPNTLS